MRHQNSVFHSVLNHVPWPVFDRLVETHVADARVRRLTTKSQFVALLYGQLSGASSLREIVTGVESHAARLYHLGATTVRRSTLADANARRPVAVFMVVEVAEWALAPILKRRAASPSLVVAEVAAAGTMAAAEVVAAEVVAVAAAVVAAAAGVAARRVSPVRLQLSPQR